MKKIILALAVLASLSSVAVAKITVSQQAIEFNIWISLCL